MKPFFSVVIPTLNEETNLPILLTSLSRQSFRDFEVIVADSESADRTRAVAMTFSDKIPCFRLVNQKTKNVSAARNYGAAHAGGDYLAFFDADVIIGKDFLETIHSYTVKKNCDALTVWHRPKESGLTGEIMLRLLNISLSLTQKIYPVANGSCMIMKKTLFEKSGGFDDSIIFGEDFDLMKRLHKYHIDFAVLRHPKLFLSTRRFEKEGLMVSLYKSVYAIFYQLFAGPIRKPIFHYEMGGQYYKK